MKKNILKIIIIIFVFVFPLIVLGEEAGRGLEVEYPEISGTKPETVDFPLAQYVVYVYNFFIYIGGTLAVISIFIAGLTYLTSLGKPEKLASARKRIVSVFLGVIILLSSFLILRTIYLPFTEIKTEPLEPLEPVVFEEGEIFDPSISYKPGEGMLKGILDLMPTIEDATKEAGRVSRELKESASVCDCSVLEPVCTYKP